MNQTQWIDLCRTLFERNGIPCTDPLAERLYTLTRRMLEVNQTMNLTAITDPQGVILRHYVDSLLISPLIPEGATLIDVGCGAGFPSLPLALARPDLRITALDGTAKRIRYVEETAALLGLKNLTAIAGRAEEYAKMPDYREKFQIATARAVASLPVLCELCLPYVQVGGQMIAMKSQQASEELTAAKRCIELCGATVGRIHAPSLIGEDGSAEERRLILLPKIAHTPKIYPRHFSKISKKPL